MKTYIYALLLLIGVAGCGASKDYLERSDADKALVDAAKRLSKKPNDDKALTALPVLYTTIQNQHLAAIQSYSTGNNIGRWDKLISEYKDLQNAYDAIMNSSAAFRLVTPTNYTSELLEVKEKAAKEYYDAAVIYEKQDGRENAKKAYSMYAIAEKYVPGFKDVRERKAKTFENAVVNVIINPVEDKSFFFNSGWGNYGYNYSNEYFQQNLIRDLQSNTNYNRYAARFYTEWEARRANVQPDWVIDLQLRNLDIPFPINRTYSRQSSARVQTGTDTSGHAIYKTVYANVNITSSSFNAYGTLDVIIRDINSGTIISNRSFSDRFDWNQESATYTGDSRALSAQDRSILNNRSYNNTPRKEEVLYELYRDIYPQVKNNISYAVDW